MFIVNCDDLMIFKTFNSLENALDFLHELNKTDFDGRPFSLFGPSDKGYKVDSVVLRKARNPHNLYEIFIRRINKKGEIIDIMTQ